MNILVTRTDRLGDVILATPVLRRLRELHPAATITFLVRKEWLPVLEYGAEIDRMIFDPGVSKWELTQALRARKFDVAYVLKDEPVVSAAVKGAGIPTRIGPYSSLRSFFCFNAGRLQRRSSCKMHEAEYNLDLIEPRTPAMNSSGLPRAWVETASEAKERAARFLDAIRFKPQGFIVIHPGSSGSSRYVSVDKLHALARGSLKRGVPVLVTGGPAELGLLQAFQEQAPGVKVLSPEDGLGLSGMAEVYRKARVVLAHGTGPLHLAAAVETPVIAIFPPIFVLSEKRWGPLIEKRSVWVPPVTCPEKFRCRGEKCRYYDCMDLFESDVILQTVETLSS